MIGHPKDIRDGLKMAVLVQIGVLGIFIQTILLGNGDALVHHQSEDLRTMFQHSEKTDYFGVIEKVTPVVYRIPKNNSEPRKEISPHTTHPLPRNLDFTLRRQQGLLSMRLHRMRDVIGSHTRVEWTAEGEVMESNVLSTKCVYHGKVDGMENSLATIDLCNDMKGVIRTDDEDIYLQPIMQYAGSRHRNPDKETYTGEGGGGGGGGGGTGTHFIRVHPRKENRQMNFPEGASIDLTNDNSQRDNAKQRMDGARERRTRARRQALHRGPRYMQVLLVTDGSLVRFHGRDLIEQYLLTQMSIVDNIYHHPTLGFEINLIVVKIKIIDDSVVRHVVSRGDGKTSLDRFCHWANEEKPKNKNKDEDFDVAVYITKEEIGPAGYAPVTGMCNPMRSCALVKDDGTSSAFVIAHEIGHIFGMIHDGHGNDCSDDPSDGKIMASMVQSHYHSYYWTRCNNDAMEKYLVDIHCLDDKPKDPSWPVYNQPYGQSWSLDEQCRQEFGSGFSLCRAFDHLDPCYHLWCSHSSNNTLCKTKRGPPLPGTTCGRGKWCMAGSCTDKRTVSVDGGWSTWKGWDPCSRTCGVGMQFRIRTCTAPAPTHGGKDCKGDREEFRTCNTQRCPQLTDIREEQCATYNERRFDDGRRHIWLPMENKNASEMCKYTCVSMETGTVFVSESNAIDGTFCSYDQPHHVCVKGSCHPVGCDGVLNSRQRDDQCGQCGGNGSTCKRVTGVITEPLSKKEYHRILVVPAKARNIAIREMHSTPHLAHFIAVRDTATERWYLNGNTQQGPSKHFVAHGTSFTYSASTKEGETLTARGPLLAPVDIMIYSMSTKLPPAFDYEYTIPPEVTQITTKQTTHTLIAPQPGRYVWSVIGRTNCTKPCGSGAQFELFTCVDTEKNQLSDGFCSEESRPTETRKDCNIHPCGPYTFWWDMDDWSTVISCSASCGTNGLQQRRVQCVTDNRGKTTQVEPAYCNQRTMPLYIQPCNRFPCTTPAEDLPSSPRISTTTEGDAIVVVQTGNDWSSTSATTHETTTSRRVTSQRYPPTAESVVTSLHDFVKSTASTSTQHGSTQYVGDVSSTEVHSTRVDGRLHRGDSTTKTSHPSTTTSKQTASTLLEVLTSTTPAEVNRVTASTSSRIPIKQNSLVLIPVVGGSSNNGKKTDASTQASMFQNKTFQPEIFSSSTTRTFSLEEEELVPVRGNHEETTPPLRTGTSSSFEADDTDDSSSSSESDIERQLFESTTDRNRNPGRSTTSLFSPFKISSSFQPVDPPVISVTRIDGGRPKSNKKIDDNGRQSENDENKKSAYSMEVLVTGGSVVQTTPTSSAQTSSSTSDTRITTTTTTTAKAPTSPSVVPNAAAKSSTMTKTTPATTPTSTATTVKHTTAVTSTAITTLAKAPIQSTISTTTITNAKANGKPSSTTSSTTQSTIKATFSSDSPVVNPHVDVTGSGTSSVFVIRPRAKTTVRKYSRKYFNSHTQPESATLAVQDEGRVPRSKMMAVDAPHHIFPSTQPPYVDCSSDRSMLFCRAGANQDRCSKPAFYTLCCVSCRMYLSVL